MIERPFIPEDRVHNGHMYYIKVRDLEVRTKLIALDVGEGEYTASSIIFPFTRRRQD